MATTDIHFVAGALTPVKRGIRFLGGATDDGVQVDAAAAAMVAGNHTIGTITAWIMVPDNTGDYAFLSFGDSAANVEYFTCAIEAGTVRVMAVITTPTTQMDVNTATATITPHKWHHIAIVQNADILKIYIDGVDMALTWTVGTDKAQWFDDMNAVDGAHIGCADSEAGGGGLTKEFKGYISDVRIWSGTVATGALSQLQVKDVMNGKTVGTAHNIWSLDQTLVDAGSGADNGTAVGDINYSDANEFASRLSFLETVPLTADMPVIMCSEGVGYAYVILAA